VQTLKLVTTTHVINNYGNTCSKNWTREQWKYTSKIYNQAINMKVLKYMNQLH